MKPLEFFTAFQGVRKFLFMGRKGCKEWISQKEILRAWLIGLVTVVLLFVHSSCKEQCGPESSSILYQYSYGTWRLAKIVSPTRTQTVFAKKQTLKVYFSNGRLPGPNTKETIFRDTTTIAQNEWLSYDPDCANLNFIVTYDNVTLKRKYWVSSKGEELRATGYVNQLGSKADSLMYFYVPNK